jgi:2-polyprenyl-3-methyl-5-hydroxy-6-metoxy-1,4-benzoquinol methylase
MLNQRVMTPERMDAPDLDAEAHQEALAGLRRLNAAARAAAQLARPIRELAWTRKLAAISILDVACGGGDVPAAVATALRRADVDARLTLTDRSAKALAIAAEALRKAGFQAQVAAGDAPQNLPGGTWDFVTNTLFLHHLQRADAVATLRAMAQRARVAVVVSDLRRSTAGFLLAWAMCRVLSRSRIVHFDGPVSVRAAWTIQELRAMAAEAGMTGAVVRKSWPARMLLVWEQK